MTEPASSSSSAAAASDPVADGGERILAESEALDAAFAAAVADAAAAVPASPKPRGAKRARAVGAAAAEPPAAAVVPPPLFAAGDTLLRVAYLRGAELVRLLARLSNMGEKIILDFASAADDADGGGGLTVRKQHGGRVLGAQLRVPRAAFAVYSAPEAHAFKLDTGQLKGFAKSVVAGGGGSALVFEATRRAPYADSLLARVVASDGATCTRVFDRFDIDERADFVRSMRGERLKHTAHARLSAAALDRLVLDNKNNGAEFIDFDVVAAAPAGEGAQRPHALKCYALSSTSRLKAQYVRQQPVDALEVTGVVRAQAFALVFLQIIVACRDVMDTVVVHFGAASQAPLFCEFLDSASFEEDGGFAATAAPSAVRGEGVRLHLFMSPKHMEDEREAGGL